jgi:uracil-DNA glycosylase
LKLEDLRKKVEEDKILPLRETAQNLVFGEGNTEAEIFLLGEAPGRQEDEQGKPFVGRAGKFLNELLAKMGLKREDVWITNMIYFRPPKNRPPTPKEILAFSKYIDSQLKIIDPKIIITLGRFSLSKFLPKEKITQIHGKPLKIKWNDKGITLLPMFHPSAGLRSPGVRKILEEDFKRNQKLLNSSLL